MKKHINIEKVIRQHAELNDFFTAGFSVASKQSQQPPQTPDPEKQAEMKKITQQIAQCRKCRLSATRTNTVPGEGNPNAKIVFVGEAPGADEDAQGRPFVGRAGKLLEKIITAMGLKRNDVFIGNILKCRPPDNRDPSLEEIQKCIPYLEEQLRSIKPEIIVALGAHAARNLLQVNKPIGQLRAKMHDYYLDLGHPPIKLIATYHPAYLLRSYTVENRTKVWDDMKMVLQLLNLPIPQRRRK